MPPVSIGVGLITAVAFAVFWREKGRPGRQIPSFISGIVVGALLTTQITWLIVSAPVGSTVAISWQWVVEQVTTR